MLRERVRRRKLRAGATPKARLEGNENFEFNKFNLYIY